MCNFDDDERGEYEDLLARHIGEITNDDWQRFHELNDKRIAELKDFIIECRDTVLYPLSHSDTDLGKLAEGLGSATVNIL